MGRENLEILFAHDPQVFVAGGSLWHPVQSRAVASDAPDAIVVYRPDGQRFLSSIELFQQAEQERQRTERLASYLRTLGIDPDNLPYTRPLKGDD